MCLIMKIFVCIFFCIYCVFFCFLCTFFAFLLLLLVVVDVSDIAIKSGITNMVKAIILVISNTPPKKYRIAQYTNFWNRLHSLILLRLLSRDSAWSHL
jgi:hypothetical protein